MTIASDIAVTPEPEVVTARKPTGALLRQSMRLWRTRIGVALVVILAFVALFGPFFAPHGPTDFVGAPTTSARTYGAASCGAAARYSGWPWQRPRSASSWAARSG